MGNDLKTVIYEFYGLTGCGKSTVSHLLAEHLRSEGWKVAEPTFVLDHKKNKFFRKFYKMIMVVLYAIKQPKLFFFCKEIVKKCGYCSISEVMSQIINLMMKYFLIAQYQKSDFIIFDEGFYQAAVALAVKEKPDYSEKILRCLLKRVEEQYDFKPVYLMTDIECALRNMEMRLTNDSRIEREPDDKRKRTMLANYQKACDAVKGMNSLCIDVQEKTPYTIMFLVKTGLKLK